MEPILIQQILIGFKSIPKITLEITLSTCFVHELLQGHEPIHAKWFHLKISFQHKYLTKIKKVLIKLKNRKSRVRKKSVEEYKHHLTLKATDNFHVSQKEPQHKQKHNIYIY